MRRDKRMKEKRKIYGKALGLMGPTNSKSRSGLGVGETRFRGRGGWRWCGRGRRT